MLIIVAAAIAAGSQSCQQTDGDVGDWFGSWHFESIDINGDDSEYSNDQTNRMDLMVNFHGKIFNISYLNGHEIYGTWSVAGEVLTLIADPYTGDRDREPQMFNPYYPNALHFAADTEQIEITVVYIGTNTMEWQYIDQNGDLITYHLRKYP